MATHNAYLLLGSNIGDRASFLQKARAALGAYGELLGASQLYETEAWGKEDQAAFLNQAVVLSTSLEPVDLLEATQKVEESIGREDTEKWQPRIIDIDILAIDDLIIDTEKLQVPHPWLHKRNFALVPLMEIASDWVHPVFKLSVEEMYLRSDDQREVFIFSR